MKTATNNPVLLATVAFALALSAMAVQAASAAPAEARTLFVHGYELKDNAGPLWIANVELKGSASRDGQFDRTVVTFRERFGDASWIELPKSPIPARVIGVTSHKGELVVTLKPPGESKFAREWAWFGDNRYAPGPVLPNKAEILAMAGDRSQLWALSRIAPSGPGGATTQQLAVEADTRPSTRPSTRPAAAVTTIAADPKRPLLYMFQPQGWALTNAAWPEDLPIDSLSDFSMAVIDGTPTVAVRPNGSTITILRLEAERWATVAKVAGATTVSTATTGPSTQPVSEEVPPGHFKLLPLGRNRPARAALWVQGDPNDGPAGALWTGDPERPWTDLKVRLTDVPPGGVDLTVVGDQLRMVYRKEREKKLYHQALAFDGGAAGEPSPVTVAARRSANPLNMWVIVTMIVMTVLILNAVLRRRTAEREEERDRDED